jgi:hypothetical protein
MLAAAGRPIIGSAVGVGSAAALVPKLPDVPSRVAFRLAATGNLRAGEQIANAVRRTWWPIVGLLAIRSRTARRILLVSVLASGDLRVAADDVAYSIGVWRGMLAARTVRPLLPDIRTWPDKQA